MLDEPSIGLHQRDNDRLIATLKHLRDIGNSVLVVEHDEDMIRAADHCVDMGPGAGVHGGRVTAQGTPAQIEANPQSLTGRYLSRNLRIDVPTQRRPFVREKRAPNAFSGRIDAPAPEPTPVLSVHGARANNLQLVSVDIPVGLLTCVTGVSGSGKSTLINDTLYTAAARSIHRAHA